MKRRLFWMMGIPAAAQVASPVNSIQDGIDRDGMNFVSRLMQAHHNWITEHLKRHRKEGQWKPINNECPVCGTMAEPHTLKPVPFCGESASVFEFTVVDGGWVSKCEQPPVLPVNITRCKHCNAAFWQDSV